MTSTLRAYADLMRVQFSIAGALLFCAGCLLAGAGNGGVDGAGLARAALIGFLWAGAAFVLNDYLDRETDRKDAEPRLLTRYWRLSGSRPLAEGLIPAQHALFLFLAMAGLAALLAMTLPYPRSVYVLLMMAFAFVIGIFCEEEKRIPQAFPFPEVIGRTDFALFMVAGYICAGLPDITALLIFLFIYPFALAHDGVNDLVDEENDRARDHRTIATIYDAERTRIWVAGFTVIHIMMAFLFFSRLPVIGRAGVCVGLALLVGANVMIIGHRTPEAALKALPFFHIAMVLYAAGICAGALTGM